MSVLSVAPELVSVAAGDLSGVGSAIAEANLLAAGPTLGVVAPAADSVSAELAALFGVHAETYQGVSAQGQVFHEEFVSTLTRSSAAYSRAEAESASGLGRGHAADGLRLLSSRQHNAAAGAGLRLRQPGRPALWQPGMSDPRLITPHHSLPAGARLWHPGVPGFKAHSFPAPRLFAPRNELMGGTLGGARGILQDLGLLIRQTIQNQIGYLKFIAQSLGSFVKDELTAIIGLPKAFLQSVNDLLHGNIAKAMRDVETAFARLFIWGQEYVGTVSGAWSYRFTGPLADLWQLMQIPAQEAHNLANALTTPVGAGFAGKVAQNIANHVQAFADCFHFDLSYYFNWITLGKPLALALDILGAPILAYRALEDGLQTAFDALMSGHPLKSVLDLVITPASVLHAFLFGQGELYVPRTVFGSRAYQFEFNIGGLFAPLDYESFYHNGAYELMGAGTQTGGLIPALVSMLPPKLQNPLFGLGSFLDTIIAILERHPAQP